MITVGCVSITVFPQTITVNFIAIITFIKAYHRGVYEQNIIILCITTIRTLRKAFHCGLCEIDLFLRLSSWLLLQ
jgi:mannose/fructose/N-acetylgalactosamine-specific phosphotransferase system component IIB